MSDNRWQRIEDIFHRAVDLAPEARSDFLNQACGADRSLRREVESLLAHESENDTTFARPAGDDLPRTIAHYRILAKLGEGGMGVVYRATDTKLGRNVAIKSLPAAFAHDPDRMARFQREAEVLASLNHPNIAAIYEVAESDDTRALVMELVEGETLPAGLPLDTALRYARQIAEALEYAHERGIVHRDLKPANVRVTSEGSVKLLDFGLAKAIEDPRPTSGDPADSPTLPMSITRVGVILGTAAYMSPEQALGKPADRRADIWSFGAVLYEMLAGKRAFCGKSASDALATVLELDPDWDALPAETPFTVRRLVERCLEKDRKRRLQAIGEARIAIEDLLSGVTQDPESRRQPAAELKAEGERAGERLQGPSRPVWAVVATLLGLLVLSTAWLAWIHFRGRTRATASFRFQIPFVGMSVTGGAFALSPDGRQLAFAAVGPDGIKRLWIRALDSLEPRPLLGTEAAQAVIPPIFWSPDSRFIAFDADGKLKKIDVAGGQVQILCDLPGLAVGGSWSKDGVIIFGNDAPGVGLMRVSASGGKASPLTNVDRSRNEGLHVLPSFLPDGRHFLYYRNSRTPGNAGTYVGSIDAEPGKQDSTQLLATVSAVYASYPDSKLGQLLFLRRGTLLAQAFDAARLQLIGEPVPVAEQVGGYIAYGFFSLSATGILAYRTRTQDFQLNWLDRQGKTISRVWEPGPYTSLAVSADGTRAVLSRNDLFQGTVPWNLWLVDLVRGTSKRFTSAVGRNDYPVWSPDGSRVVFVSSREGGTNSTLNLYQKLAGGAEDDDLLLRSGETMFPTSWSHDGRFLLYTVADPKNKNDIWVLSMEAGHQRTRLLGTQYSESQAQFSPDSRWIAYTSDASGRNEVYVRAFPVAKEDFIVSRDGGSSPRWRGDGKELYYISTDGKVMAVAAAGGGLFQPGTPKPLFQVSSVLPEWNVTADGKRFLFAVQIEQTQTPFTVVSNWLAGQKK